MNISFFLQDLIKHGAKLWSEDEQLRCQGPGEVLTPEVLEILKQHKSEFLDLLREGTTESEEYPLSYGQQALWFINQGAKESTAYNVAVSLRICSPLNVQAMECAFQYLVDRHPMLRAYFPVQDGKPMQRIRESHNVWFQIVDAVDSSTEQLRQQVIQEYQQPFDLDTGPLLRIHLFHRSEEDHLLLITVHHIVIDGWSLWVLMDEFSKVYSSITAGQTPNLEPLRYNYRDYIQWQTEMLVGTEGEKLWQYWQSKLSGEIPVLQLPTDRSRPPAQTFHGATINFPIDETLTRQLRDLARTEGTTLFTVLMAAFHILLHRYTGQNDILVGTPAVGRDNTDFTGTAGYFVNPVVIRTDSTGNPTFHSFLQKVSETVLEAIGHQGYPFPLLVKRLQPKRSSGFSPLFQVDFVLQKAQVGGFTDLFDVTGKTEVTMNWGGLEIQPFVIPQEEGQFDLTLEIIELEDSLSGHFKYNTDLFNADTIERISEHFLILLDGIINNPAECISQLPLLSETEIQQLQAWNQTETDYPRDKTIYQLFEEQVVKTPDNIAVVFEKEQLTYRELNVKSNQLASYILSLKENYKKADKVVKKIIAVYLGNEIDTLISVYAVLKSGYAYVPLDINDGGIRTKDKIQDLDCSFIITNNKYAKKLHEIVINSNIVINMNISSIYTNSNLYYSYDEVNATDLAYGIYTSGSTGVSKASMITHRSFVNLNYWYANEFNLNESSKVVICSAFCFDLTQKNYFSTLLKGGTIFFPDINDNAIFDSDTIANLVLKHNISRVNCSPGTFGLIIDSLENLQDNNKFSFDYAFLGGEPIPTILIEKVKNLDFCKQIVNTYGPSECTDVTTYYRVNNTSDNNVLPIGKPLHNVQHFVLDSNLSVLPIGTIGELYIGGACVGDSYINREELTAEKFIPNPFAADGDIEKGYTRLYKTGDLVRWLPDGNLEYIGRNDFQVKIRGYRIELGEIENTLTSIKNIKQACVLAKEKDDNKYLVGYFVTENSIEIKEENILDQLSKQLPDYMIPGALVRMESFPLTINGKLDRKSLPDPEFTNEDSYVAPTTDLEIRLCKIWQEVLDLEKVGITDDFFRIGGESILAIKLSHQLSKKLDSHIAVSDIFKYKTVSSLVDYLNSNETEHIKIIPQNLNGYPLSFAQERLWFIEQYEQGTNAYHIPMFVELQKNTDQDKLKDVIQLIIQRHEVLRTIFNQEDGEYHQIVVDGKLQINEYNNSEVDISKQVEKDINTSFDLQEEFPIRASFYHKGNRTYFLVNIHHIASDGWSMDILLREINGLYNDKKLSKLPIQYKDFAHWQREYLQGEVLQNQLNYWQENLQGYVPLALPTDKARPKQIDYSGDDALFTIDGELSNKLRNLSKEQGCSMYTALLSGFYILLSKYTSQNDIVLGTSIANRHHSEIQDLIGFFVNSLALRENINQENSIVGFISQVQNSLIKAQRHQDLPFEKLVEVLKVEQDTSRHPIFQVMFGVQSFGADARNKLFKFTTLNSVYSIAKYDLTCFMDDSQKEIQGSLNFATALYEKSTIERMVDHYLIVLEQMVSNKHKRLKEYSVLTQADYQQIVIEWNRTDKEYPKDKTICQLFEEQVLKTPDNISVVFEDWQLTYAELNAKSNQLARYLQLQTTIKPDTLIALCLDRSLEMILGILGIMKAGGAYVPIDPEYPEERINYILEDTQTDLVLTQSHLVGRLQKITDVRLIELNSECYEKQEITNLPIQNKPTDLAYVIYTSGTTGKPKGVLQSHGNVQRLFSATDHQFKFSDKDIWTLYHSYIFDFSVWEIWGALTFGGKLVIPNNETVKDIPAFVELCIKNKISVLNQTPSAFYAFADNLSNVDVSELSIKRIIFGGDALNINLLDDWWQIKRKYDSDTKLINMYGITETTVHVTYKGILEDGKISSNIGRAISDLTSYVLDANNKAVPIGVIGELHIGGAGLSRGYLNNPDLTAHKFIPNPFATNSDIEKGYTRLYKTGDLVRWLPDGNLKYIGRNDFQVKIRGYRIELGEIESALTSIVSIKQACVLAKEKDDNKYLVGYFITENSRKIKEENILDQLAKQLPEYMVPTSLVQMEPFPLTINGKLDRKSFA